MLTGIDPQIIDEPIPKERLFDSINVILSYQNADGGMATYEQTRSYPFIEVTDTTLRNNIRINIHPLKDFLLPHSSSTLQRRLGTS